MHTINSNVYEDRLIAGYREAIYFTECGDFGQPGFEDNLDPEFWRESIIDCLSFYRRVAPFLLSTELQDAGRDFWLSRNGHGAGFWDGGWPTYGDMFDKIALSYGEVDSQFENQE